MVVGPVAWNDTHAGSAQRDEARKLHAQHARLAATFSMARCRSVRTSWSARFPPASQLSSRCPRSSTCTAVTAPVLWAPDLRPTLRGHDEHADTVQLLLDWHGHLSATCCSARRLQDIDVNIMRPGSVDRGRIAQRLLSGLDLQGLGACCLLNLCAGNISGSQQS